MELTSYDVVFPHGGHKPNPIVRDARNEPGVFRLDMIRVHKITMDAGLYSAKNRSRSHNLYLIPSPVRNFEIRATSLSSYTLGVLVREPPDSTRYDVQPAMRAKFIAFGEQDLETK